MNKYLLALAATMFAGAAQSQTSIIAVTATEVSTVTFAHAAPATSVVTSASPPAKMATARESRADKPESIAKHQRQVNATPSDITVASAKEEIALYFAPDP